MEKIERLKFFINVHRFDIALFVLRFVLAYIFVAHAAILITFAGDTIDATEAIGLPGVFGVILALVALLSGIMMLTGFVVEVAAYSQMVMALALLIFTNSGHGFFVQNGGYEYVLLVAAASYAVALLGPGKIVLEKRYARTPRSLREHGVDAESHPLAT